jgi:hypothetical protein
MLYIIYKKNDDNFYLGQTKNIKRRMYTHKNCAENKINIKLYNYINNNGGWDEWKHKIISDDDNDTETQWYHILKPTLNTNVCGRTFLEYQKDHRQKYTEYLKKWRSKNPTYMRDYMRQYNKKKKETI